MISFIDMKYQETSLTEVLRYEQHSNLNFCKWTCYRLICLDELV
jgi:hypothetical protein